SGSLFSTGEGGRGDEATTARASPPKGLEALLLLLFLPLLSQAQDVPLPPLNGPLTSAQAVSQALQTNGTVQAAQRALEAQQAVRRAAYDVGRTALSVSYGQYNSYRNDNNLTLSQSLALPGVYRSQARLVDAQIAGRQQELSRAQADLRRQVRLSYEQAVYARHRLRVLRGQDSLHTEFLRAAELRFKTGEVARLEPATALVQQGETRVLLRQARTDYEVARRQLQALLQRPNAVAIVDSVLRPLVPALALSVPVDSALLTQNPEARVLRQQLAERQATTRAEKAQGLPTLSLGYFNQSLIGPQTIGGVGGPERYYDAGNRFQGVQAGVAVPLWLGPLRARVRGALLQEQVAAATYARQQAELAGRLDELRARLTEQQQRLAFYEQTGLPQATIIVRLSTRAFKAGEVGYAEHLLNLNRALGLRTARLQALLDHNQTVIELDYLLGGAQ
ncbi:MAG TPA: TolC family protein, partial [Hymenobacter sp.]|nr:TolC family protein [Hymenobacter sp.]